MAGLVETLEITSGRRLHKEQLARWSDMAWPRQAIDRWWREKFNQGSKRGPKKKPVPRGEQ